jgi:thioesterase domain-containing protein
VNGDDPQLAAFRGDLDDMSLPVTIRYPGWEEMLAPEYRFDDFLDAILRQIDAHRCAGPIRLAGYSLGGLLAFAAAEALLARGREVGFFGILDASLSHAPMMMRRGAFGMIRRMTRVPSFVWRGSVKDNLARVAAHYLSTPKARPLLRRLLARSEAGPFSDLRFALHYWVIRFRRANLAWDWLRERPHQPIPVRAVLFRAAEAAISGPPDLGWNALCPNLRVIEVPGAHLTMLQMPNRPTVAARFREALALLDRPAPA